MLFRNLENTPDIFGTFIHGRVLFFSFCLRDFLDKRPVYFVTAKKKKKKNINDPRVSACVDTHTQTRYFTFIHARSSEILKLEMKKMPKSIEKVHVIDYYDGYVMSVTLLYTTVSIELVSIIRVILLFWFFQNWYSKIRSIRSKKLKKMFCNIYFNFFFSKTQR